MHDSYFYDVHFDSVSLLIIGFHVATAGNAYVDSLKCVKRSVTISLLGLL